MYVHMFIYYTSLRHFCQRVGIDTGQNAHRQWDGVRYVSLANEPKGRNPID